MSAPQKVLVAQYRYHPLAAKEFARLEAAGLDVTYNRTDRRYTEDDLLAVLPGHCATIASGEPYTERVLAAAAPTLKVIARWGVGYDRVDVDACTRHGVAVAMAYGANHEAVADLAFTFIAALACDIKPVHALVAGGGWNAPIHKSVWRASVGVVGLGRIGRALARRCRGFDMRILGFDSAPDRAWAAAQGVQLVPLETLLGESDFVSLHVPATPETENLIDARRLALMKPSAYLINTARGAIIDEEALCEALASRRIAGTGLDVFRREPPVGSRLLALGGNVLYAPHWGSQAGDADARCAALCVDAALAAARGQRPGAEYVLNPQALGR